MLIKTIFDQPDYHTKFYPACKKLFDRRFVCRVEYHRHRATSPRNFKAKFKRSKNPTIRLFKTKVAEFIKSSGLEKTVKTRRIIIPGYVAQISGELEESLPGWEVVVGPGEIADFAPMLKREVESAA